MSGTSLLLPCLLKNRTPSRLRLQNFHYSIHSSSGLPFLSTRFFCSLIASFIYLQAFFHSCLLIQGSHCFLFAFSTVAPFLHLRGSHGFISTLLSSSFILQLSRVSSHHSFSFLHLPIFFRSFFKILLALIHALLSIVALS